MGAALPAMSKKPGTAHTWRDVFYGHLSLARISNSPTVVSNTLAGAALAGVLWPGIRVGLVALAMVLFYTAGMYLNDLLDYAIDCRERPERPLPSGLVSRAAAAAMTLALFGVGSVLLWLVGLLPFLSGLILMALIICYDRWHKGNPLGPLLMALCRVMVYITAFLAFSVQLLPVMLLPGGLLLLYVLGLTSIAKTENRPGVTSVTIVATLFLPTLYFAVQQRQWFTLSLVVCFTIWVAYSVSFTLRSSRRQIGRTVGQLIAGISLFDSLVLAAAGSFLNVLLALLAFVLTLFFQRYVKGT
jgi:4-hydroxybenzoate polyprenyltransferase